MDKPKRPKNLDKVEKIPGMGHAFALINEYSIFGSGRLMGESNELETDKKAEEVRRKGVRKIAELWGLSESSENVLIRKWVEVEAREVEGKGFTYLKLLGLENEEAGEGEEELGRVIAIYVPRETEDLKIEILLGEEEDCAHDLKQLRSKLKKTKASLSDSREVKKGHIYLDVTEIDYKTLCSAYKGIQMCRSALGVNKRDMKRGAPPSIDTTRALLAAEAARRGLRREEIAEYLGFNIYPAEVSNTFPLLHKYIKVGREIADKLDKLEKYLQEITGIVV
jgi:hypothetical protein